eukprot:TRINITY_DN22399_c0_g3_i1.p1 TRINITY_DN22399_c0_g3~~TRINITY_DN22399_c0_g3_i1.p1  ORF type:complete len:1516 (+),score=270.69 TRINITY_DN22399_c0_g3_i1:345-4550(+)
MNAAETVAGMDIERVHMRWVAIRLVAGGFDLTSLQILVPVMYFTRLSITELALLLTGAGLGVLRGGRWGLVWCLVDLSVQLLGENIWHFIGALIFAIIVRLVMLSPMLPWLAACPWFPIPMFAWFASMVIWMPLLAVMAWWSSRKEMSAEIEAGCLVPLGNDKSAKETREAWVQASKTGKLTGDEKQKEKKMSRFSSRRGARTVEDNTNPLMAAFRHFKECVRDQMDQHENEEVKFGAHRSDAIKIEAAAFIEIHDLLEPLEQHIAKVVPVRILKKRVKMSVDIKEYVESLAPKLSREEIKVWEKRYEDETVQPLSVGDILDPGVPLGVIRKLMKYIVWDSPVEKKDKLEVFECYFELRRRARDEVRREDLSERAVRVTRSGHFRLAARRDKAALVAAAVPELPGIRLVYWRELLFLRRLPNFAEEEHHVSLQQACEAHRSRVVVISVIHHWRTPENPDPDCITARQLLVFAHWYRKTWGKGLEIYFWIDFCCMPPEVPAGYHPEDQAEEEPGAALALQTIPENSTTQKSGVATPTGSVVGASRASTPERRINLQQTSPQKPTTPGSAGSSPLRNSSGSPETKTKLPSALHAIAERFEIITPRSSASESRPPPPRVYDGLNDALMPIIYALSDVVVLCDSGEMNQRAWVRASLGVAQVFTPGGSAVYVLDLSILEIADDDKKHLTLPDKPKVIVKPPPKPLSATEARALAVRNKELGLPPPGPGETQESLALTDGGGHGGGGSQQLALTGGTQQLALTDGSNLQQQLALVTANAAAGTQQFALALPGTAKSKELALAIPGKMPSLLETPGSAKDPSRPPGAVLQRVDRAERHLLYTIAIVPRSRVIAHPLHSEACLLDSRHGRRRIMNLVQMCISAPAAAISGDFHRQPLVFGETCVKTCTLEKADLTTLEQKAKPKDLEATTDEGEEEEDTEKKQLALPAPTAGGGEVPKDPNMLTWEDSAIDKYYEVTRKDGTKSGIRTDTDQFLSNVEADGDGKHSLAMVAIPGQSGAGERKVDVPLSLLNATKSSAESTLRQAAEARKEDPRKTHRSPPEPWKRPAAFHKDFMSVTTRLGFDRRSVEQLNANKVFGAGGGSSHSAAGTSTGGIAITEKPLELILGVAPDAPNYRGIAWEFAVCATDERWSDGLAIGFTAQDPESWPSKQAKPRRASQLPRTWLCGYSGRWFFERRSEFINYSTCQVRDWKPSRIASGDVVTAVAVSEPKAVLRILVNGKVVAEETLKRAGFPDVLKTKLWGVVDINGTCLRVALTANGGKVLPTSSIGEKDLYSRGSMTNELTKGFASPKAKMLAIQNEHSPTDEEMGIPPLSLNRDEDPQRKRPATISPRGSPAPKGPVSPAFLAASGSNLPVASSPEQPSRPSTGGSTGTNRRRGRSHPSRPSKQ